MRAGLSTVQQTLTPEAASILNHAIAEACRQGHGQTTPLQVAATLLAAPTSHLRQACIRSHPNLIHPLQCRALELCFSVALDRLPAAQGLVPGSEPPISNALMAALERAQAHQRRGCPEQQQQPLLAVKVELEQLIVSILDDPSVSRVMREASFSTPAVKATIEQSINMANSHSSISLPSGAMDRVSFRLSNAPSILGNLGRNQHFEPSNRNFDEVSSRPISQRNPYLSHRLQTTMGSSDLSSNRNEEIRKVMEILLRVRKRNPILVGDKEPEAVLKELMQRIERGETPEQLRGVQILETEISSFCSGNKDKDHIDMKFKELDRVVESHLNGGVILNVGDLRWLVGQPKAGGGAAIGVGVSSSVQQVVLKLGHLLARHGGSGRIWIIGIATCETYLRCQVHHPSVESDWEIQPVPMAARQAPGLFQRYVVSNSVDSLTPPEAFPAMPPPLKKSAKSNDLKQKINCCSQYMANYEQELSKMEEEKKASVLSASPQSISEDQTSQALPPWLQIAKTASSAKGPDTLQAKGGRDKDFKEALQVLRGNHYDVSYEATEIMEYVEELESLPKARIIDLFHRNYAPAVIVGVGLVVCQQLCGINGVIFYASAIFKAAGYSSGDTASVGIAILQVPMTAVGAFLMDKAGRRPLLMIAAGGMSISCFIVGLSFYILGHSQQSALQLLGSRLALIGLLAYIATFSLGMGGIPWVIMSEIFPINMKGIAGSLVSLVAWFGGWAVTVTFNSLLSWSAAASFFIFCGVSAFTVLFVAKLLPETKGRTLEEIQSSFKL